MFPPNMLVFLLILPVFVGCFEVDLVVKLESNGFLVGTNSTSSNGRRVRCFLGIPYAKPPINELRFEVSFR